MQRRNAVTLLEVVVSIGIIAVLLTLLLPAIQMVRGAAMQMECMNQHKQIGIAWHNAAGQHGGRMPSAERGYKGGGESLLFALLPHIEHGTFYEEVQSGKRPRGNNYCMRQYICPADPTIVQNTECGTASYAANFQVFTGKPLLPHTFRDGTSSTIAFAEHYAYPPGTQFDWGYEGEPLAFPPPDSLTLHRPTFADFNPGKRPYDPAKDDVYPVTSGSPPTTMGSIPELTFQRRPRVQDADPRIAQTPHSGGMVIGMGDASVRTLKQSIAPSVYWSLVTPAGGERVALPD
jgi:type II secretory pathway pseudopilin PulG